MILLIRVILISLIIYLIIRSFIMYGGKGNEQEQKQDSRYGGSKKDHRISKEIGEYIDYEETKRK